ncbi:probable G-protein coupled receptor 139 [Heptranchias perlo]|uniref:probable G-protein coupled receptor 139 n=1 Tax=Heptranchias perlo TaxID=212740 RepID=UPI003559D995
MVQAAILQIKDIFYPVLASFGAPANVVTIVILSRGNCGLSKCVSVYMVAMATADLLVIIFNVIVYQIFNYHFPYSFLSNTAVCKFILYFNFATLDLSVWFTVSFSFDRFVAICFQGFKEKYWSKRTAIVVIAAASILAYLMSVPMLFSYEPERIINNVHWGCRPKVDVLTLPAWAAYNWFQALSVPLLPFIFMALFNSLTVRRILVANRARRELRGHSSKNQSDPEMENRRKSIILLFTISGSFILLWITSVVTFGTTRLSNTVYYQGDYSNPGYIATECGYLLMYLSSCSNTCIYAATQRKFREELKTLLKSPRSLILRLVKK